MMFSIGRRYAGTLAIGVLFSSVVAAAVTQTSGESGDFVANAANAVVMQPGFPSERKEEVVAGNPMWGIPLPTLSATRERPIFLPARRISASPVAVPVSAPVQPAPVIEKTPLVSLIGVVAGSDVGVAIFFDEESKENIRLRKGEGIDGWILVSVQPREAVLAKDNDTKIFKLPLPAGDRK